MKEGGQGSIERKNVRELLRSCAGSHVRKANSTVLASGPMLRPERGHFGEARCACFWGKDYAAKLATATLGRPSAVEQTKVAISMIVP